MQLLILLAHFDPSAFIKHGKNFLQLPLEICKFGKLSQGVSILLWRVEESQVKAVAKPKVVHLELDFNFQLAEYTVFYVKETTRSESVRVLQFTWQPFSSTCPLRSLSLPATLHGTTRRPELSQDIFSSPSGMTKSWTSSLVGSLLLKEVFSPTSKLFFFQRNPKREASSKLPSEEKPNGSFKSHQNFKSNVQQTNRKIIFPLYFLLKQKYIRTHSF